MTNNASNIPILYSFRRCPFAIRARSALYFSDIKVILRGVTNAGGPPTAADAITFKGIQAGSFLPIIVDYVLATGTSVTELIAVK